MNEEFVDSDLETIEEIREKEGEDKKTFKSVINKKKVGKFEMDMLFFEEE